MFLVWSAALVCLAIGATIWRTAAWRGVSVTVAFEPERAFVGEEVSLRLHLANGKRLPLPIVQIHARLPSGLRRDPEQEPGPWRGHRRRFSVPGRSEMTLRMPVVATGRGEYWLDDVDVELSDPFDLVTVRREVSVEHPLLVMPETWTGAPPRIARRLPFGTPAPAQRLFEDREHFAGVREYEPGDPMRHVHWRLSAHSGHLQTKRFEPTRSAEILIAVDVSHGEPFWYSVDRRTAERSISLASSIAREAVRAGWRTGLVANTHLRRGRGPLRVPATTSPRSDAALFGALARMPNQPTCDLAPVLREVGRRLVRRTTVIVVSPQVAPSLLHEIEVLRRRGSEVHLVSSSDEPEQEVS